MRFVSRLFNSRFADWFVIGLTIMILITGIFNIQSSKKHFESLKKQAEVSRNISQDHLDDAFNEQIQVQWYFIVHASFVAPILTTNAIRGIWRKSRLPCRHCAELIKKEARICPYCRNEVNHSIN
jgi:hypothetical protein